MKTRNIQLSVFGDDAWFRLGPIPVTGTMVTSLVVSALLVLRALALRRAVKRHPEGILAALAGLTVEWLDKLVADIVDHSEPWLVTFSGTLFLFIAACTLVGQLPGVRPPTASLATTSALAMVVFLGCRRSECGSTASAATSGATFSRIR